MFRGRAAARRGASPSPAATPSWPTSACAPRRWRAPGVAGKPRRNGRGPALGAPVHLPAPRSRPRICGPARTGRAPVFPSPVACCITQSPVPLHLPVTLRGPPHLQRIPHARPRIGCARGPPWHRRELSSPSEGRARPARHTIPCTAVCAPCIAPPRHYHDCDHVTVRVGLPGWAEFRVTENCSTEKLHASLRQLGDQLGFQVEAVPVIVPSDSESVQVIRVNKLEACATVHGGPAHCQGSTAIQVSDTSSYSGSSESVRVSGCNREAGNHHLSRDSRIHFSDFSTSVISDLNSNLDLQLFSGEKKI